MYQPSISHFAELAREKADGARRSPLGFFVGAMLAGAYIGIAMILALSLGAGVAAGERPLVMGSVFGIGLILTVFAGAELFTGYVMYLGFGVARGCVGAGDVFRMLSLVWLGNLAGSIAVTVLFVAGGGGTVFASGGELLHGYAAHKVDATAVALLARAVLCNGSSALRFGRPPGCREIRPNVSSWHGYCWHSWGRASNIRSPT